jgi:hypothetical protein
LLVTQGAYPRRKHLKCVPIGLALALPSNSKTQLERVYKDKRSSLLGLVFIDEGKKFYNIDGQDETTSFMGDANLSVANSDPNEIRNRSYKTFLAGIFVFF